MRLSQPGMRVFVNKPGDNPGARQIALRRSREISRGCCSGSSPAPQPSFAVAYTYAGQAESPDGKADVIEVKGADDFSRTAFLERAVASAADADLHGARSRG